jgi:hypothetical protein
LDNPLVPTGLELDGNANFRALVQGNDFHNSAVGISIHGDGTHAGAIDLGGGNLGSLGGNNFRGFAGPATLGKAAIVVTAADETTVTAGLNLFAAGVSPASLFVDPAATIDASQPLNPGRSFVQALYNEVLGRTGALAELDPWVGVLDTQGRAAVANGIRMSNEALGRVVDQLYLRFLGRQSDSSGQSGWISFLQHGGTLETVEDLFLTAPEYLSHINTDYVQSLYLNILGRRGNSSELTFWNNQIQSLGLAGIASAFTHSSEYRLNTLRLYFQTLLHRTPADTELAPLTNTPLSLLDLEGVVLSSPEFFANG